MFDGLALASRGHDRRLGPQLGGASFIGVDQQAWNRLKTRQVRSGQPLPSGKQIESRAAALRDE